MPLEVARKIIDTETRAQETKHWKAWRLYKDHKKVLDTMIINEPAKPKILGVKKWRADHSAWESERDRLLESIRSDLELLGVKRAPDWTDMDKAHREAAARHERLKEYAAEEALCLHPDAAAIIREDDARREREERARREAEEAKERIEKENHRRFRVSIQELVAKFGKEAFIITNAQDGTGWENLRRACHGDS
jgi:hypothetical protein